MAVELQGLENFKEYVVVNGRKFRKGYTTGSCAAAAAKAATCILLEAMKDSAKLANSISNKVSNNLLESFKSISIDTPAGIKLNIPIFDININADTASYVECSVVKDGGDDPDATHGLKIFAKAKLIKVETYTENDKRVIVVGGEGVGTVTLPGLKVPVGQTAINPVPMSMIKKEVLEVLPQGMGVKITISVPGGEEVAKQTYNPRLGIVGGISILGTTGIVNPMSEEAWKDSLAMELSIRAAQGKTRIVFAFGNYGEDFLINKFHFIKEDIVKISNFIGFMLDKAIEYEFKNILLVGHPGKLVKVAAGIFQTHSRIADARLETLTAYAGLEGANKAVIQQIYDATTTEGAMEIINFNHLEGIYKRIVENAAKRCEMYCFGKIQIGVAMFNAENDLIFMNDKAEAYLKGEKV